MARGVLIILSGPSGVGKGTIREKLFQHKEFNLQYSISMTTRAPRVGEKDKEHYFFVDEKTFLENVANNNLLEWAQFVGNYYGTPKDYVEKLLDAGKSVVLEIEIQGAEQVIDKCKDALSIFIMPPSIEELEKRIRGRRSEPEEIVKQRMDKAKAEMNLKGMYRYVVLNDTVDNAVNNIVKILKENKIGE